MSTDRASELRDAFDRAFADAPPGPAPATADLLRARIGREAFLIPLVDIAALHADLYICPVPSHVPALLGLASLRSAIVPVYDLRLLLHLAPDASPRWCVVERDASAAFAFERFEGLSRVPGELVRGIVTTDGIATPVLDLRAIARSITHGKER